MATRIFDLDIESPPRAGLEAPGCQRALVLVRARGLPVGQVYAPITEGRLSLRELRAALLEHLPYEIAGAAMLAELGAAPPDPYAPSGLSASIAVCTRERPEDLARCLAALREVPDDGQELLVVDNRPETKATRDVVGRFPGVRYLREDRRGLDAARNRALSEADGEIVAFLDDDAVADPMWLRGLLRPFLDPSVGCVTGLTLPYELETDGQEMFEAVAGFSHRGFRRRVFQSPPHDPLVTGPIGAGANMAIRRAAAAAVGPFDEALDAGTASQSGGDHDYFMRLLKAGWRVVYEPAALNRHRHRRTWDELERAVRGYGVGVYAHWTRSLLVEGEWRVVRRAWDWFRHDQAPALLLSLLREDPARPRALLWAELRGCWAGPFAYLRARRQARLDARAVHAA